ncbi:cache domain-containing protein [Thiomicrorhabdus aquaedulcis]|uniref:cache domain-containing protein n=1 Tax=Thiomicrorhabdus aquaedulcis TaxID=2211106 RepID=UPI000FD8A70B|nr:cache domain-containing protein [Thiomicrorhabdus aquaedulcis]
MSANLRATAKINEHGVILSVNKDYLDLLGYRTDNDMVEHKIGEFRSRNFPSAIQDDIVRIISSNHPYTGFTIETMANGQDIYLAMTLIPLGTAGQYKGYTAIKRALTPVEVTDIKTRMDSLAKGHSVINNGVIKNKFYMRTFGNVFKLKSLPMMIAVAVITTGSILAGAYVYEQTQTALVKKSSLMTYANAANTQIDGMIAQKEVIGETNLVGITKSSELKTAIKTLDTATLIKELSGVSAHYRESSDLKNVVVQLYDPQGNSIYRSWVQDHEQTVSPSGRGYVKDMLKNKTKKSYFVFDEQGLSIKSLVPVLDQGSFIGLAEMTQRFQSVKKELEANSGHYF